MLSPSFKISFQTPVPPCPPLTNPKRNLNTRPITFVAQPPDLLFDPPLLTFFPPHTSTFCNTSQPYLRSKAARRLIACERTRGATRTFGGSSDGEVIWSQRVARR